MTCMCSHPILGPEMSVLFFSRFPLKCSKFRVNSVFEFHSSLLVFFIMEIKSHQCSSSENRNYKNLPLFAGALTVGLVRQCQTIHGRDRTCIPPRLPPEWVTTLFFIIMGIISLTVTCGLLVASHWRREATKYARWIAFTGSKYSR